MKAVIIFSGFNTRAIIAFIRTLDKHRLEYAIIAKSPNDEIFSTQYKHKVSATRGSLSLDFDEIASTIKRAQKKIRALEYLIAPSTEALNRLFLKNRVHLNKIACTIPLVESELYQKISDKKRFSHLCSHYNIDVPNELLLSTSLAFPFVAKPKSYYASDGKTYNPIIIKTREDLDLFEKKHYETDFYFQEFVEGRCIYLLYYFYSNGYCQKLSQENYLQQEDGKSMLAATTAEYHLSQHSDNFEHLFNALSFRGLVMIELKVNDKKAIMIEANPRFWGPSQLFVDAGVNLFEDLLFDYGFLLSEPNHHFKEADYFWDDGVSSNIDERPSLAFHGYSKKQFLDELDRWHSAELYCRPDTKTLTNSRLNMSKIDQLKELYQATSKHSNYQILASNLSPILENSQLDIVSRYEKERLDYILDKINVDNIRALDIGGNSGFFTFELINNGASHVQYYEGNEAHANFVKLAAEIIGSDNTIQTNNCYYLFDNAKDNSVDVTFLLNVLHHVGDDYGDTELSKAKALEQIKSSLRNMSKVTDTLVFQLGFNWKGDRDQCLFENGTKNELIEFIREAASGYFEILSIGVAERDNSEIVYKDISDDNMVRFDQLGEFLNRPIFIMKSLKR